MGLLLFAAFARAEDPEIHKLRRYGLSPTYESLRGYLRALYPAPGVEEQLEERVNDLSHPRAERREYAIRELQRAQELLDSTPMYATYMTIARRRIRGLTEEVIRSMPMAKDSYVRTAGRKALEATATPKDADLLRAALKNGDVELRAAALRALANVLGPAARNELRRFIKDASSEVRHAAAMALVELKDPIALEALVSLLEASGSTSLRTLRRKNASRRWSSGASGRPPKASRSTGTRRVPRPSGSTTASSCR